ARLPDWRSTRRHHFARGAPRRSQRPDAALYWAARQWRERDRQLLGLLRGTSVWSCLLIRSGRRLACSRGLVRSRGNWRGAQAPRRTATPLGSGGLLLGVLGFPSRRCRPAVGSRRRPLLASAPGRQRVAVLLRRVVLHPWTPERSATAFGQPIQRPPATPDRVCPRATSLPLDAIGGGAAPLPNPRRGVAAILGHRTVGTTRSRTPACPCPSPRTHQRAAERHSHSPRLLRLAEDAGRQLPAGCCSVAPHTTVVRRTTPARYGRARGGTVRAGDARPRHQHLRDNSPRGPRRRSRAA